RNSERKILEIVDQKTIEKRSAIHDKTKATLNRQKSHTGQPQKDFQTNVNGKMTPRVTAANGQQL
ncbi:Unknown protein, partial [Striga hermonthica]